ncbi:MAG TPA: hypothetical protein VK929_12730, partial [Longimicrobiales bacterium]|nr:hypothetical protein [Longimicrobiales bacterium]
MDLRGALLAVAVERPLAGGETPDQVEAAVTRIAELLDAVPEPERAWLVREALERIPLPNASLRKLEKKARQAAIRGLSRERLAEVAELAPEIRVDDLRGTIRFSLRGDEEVRINGTRYRVPVVARIVGGKLERVLLLRPADEFVTEARRLLAAELEQARRAAGDAAHEIARILDERVNRPLYNVKA